MNYEELLIETSNIMKLKGFTTATKKSYLYNTSKFLLYCKKNTLNPNDVSAKAYLLYLHNKNLSDNSIRQKLLGYSKLEVISIYTNVAKNKLELIKSPFD